MGTGCRHTATLTAPAWTWHRRHHVSRWKDVRVWLRLCQITGNTQSHRGNAREVQRGQNKGVREFPPNTPAFRPFPAHRTEGQRAELWEGRGRGAVPTPLRLYDALVTPGSSGLRAVSAVLPPGMTPRRPEGRDASVPAMPFTRIHTPASLHCCTSGYPPLWSTECLGRYPNLWSPTHPAHPRPPGPTSEKL